MTEYILLVGLIAICMVVAVGFYGEKVDEAIQGTEKMVKRNNNAMGPDKTVTDRNGEKWDVYNDVEGRKVAVPAGRNPTTGAATYDPAVHGS